jgi:hypothetical protein
VEVEKVMPTLDNHASSAYTKILYIGDSSSGKTGSLAALLADGYSMRILDMDNGLTALKQFGRAAAADLSRIEYETYRDEYKMATGGPKVVGTPKAFANAMDKLTEWSQVDDPQCITVLDSLTFLGKAAYQWAKGMNPTAKDPRQWFYAAQQAVESVLAMLTSEAYKQNVIVISHVNYREVMEGVHKGYPSAVGSALGPTVASYFDTLILAEASGSGTNVRRRIKTLPTGVIDLKMPTASVDKELPLETGLSTIFKELKGNK